MKKIILFILFAALVVNTMAQTSFANDQENLKKYWYYRQRLKDNFLFLSDGNEPGSNLPVDRIAPIVEGKDANGRFILGTVRYLEWDDCNGALPYYIMLLATEYKLLKKYANASNNNDVVAAETLHELENAVDALQRLDMFADGVVNGVYRRSDICYLMDRANSSVQSAYLPLVNHFDALPNGTVKIGYKFAETIHDTPVDNSEKARYNSVDNVIKFIETEAVVWALLRNETAAYGVCGQLWGLTRVMIQNMYHPIEPRSFFDRDQLANETGLMQKTWYLKDPDLAYKDPDGLLEEDHGGAGDTYTYITSYGYAKSAKSFGVDAKPTDFSMYLFKRSMTIPRGLYSRIDVDKIVYSNCNLSSHVYHFVDVSGNYPNVAINLINPWPFCQVSEIKTKSQVVNSDWFVRTLATVNDISPSWVVNNFFPSFKSTYKYLVKKKDWESDPLEQLPLIWSILNNASQISDDDREYIGGLLDEAPECGPQNVGLEIPANSGYYEYQYPSGAYEWSSPNRFVWPNLRGASQHTWKRAGYFNGIDYMVLHNLYWLTKVDVNERSTTYVDAIVETQPRDISSKSEHVYAKNTVNFKPGFTVQATSDYKYVAGIASDMRTTYDVSLPFTKVNITGYGSSCTSIFTDEVKSAFITDNNQSELEARPIVNVYPNPAKELLTITSNQTIQQVQLVNATGKVMFNAVNVNTNKHTFNLSKLKQGLYFVKTTTTDGYEKVEKVLKKE